MQRLRDLGEHRFARRAVVRMHADLHQRMRGQGHVDLAQHRRCQPVLADADDGMQVMRLGAQRAPLLGREVRHPRSLTPRRGAGGSRRSL
jgi:hypothetical protein